MGINICKVAFISSIITVFLLLLLCTAPEYGGGVETTNGITVAISGNQITGSAPAGSQIILCDTSWDLFLVSETLAILLVDTTVADADGKFNFDVPYDGYYNLTGRNYNADSGTIIKNIRVNHLNTTNVSRSSGYMELGSISGMVVLTSEEVRAATVSIIGTGLGITTDSNGVYIIDKVPAGIYTVTASCKITSRVTGIDEYYTSTENNITISNERTVHSDFILEKVN